MMKSYVYLVIIKQWKHYLALIGILLCVSIIIWGIQQNLNKTLRIPVAVQDMSNSQQSAELIHKLRHHDIIQLEKISPDDGYIDERVSKKEAVVSMTIPKDYATKLSHNHLQHAINLYARDDFIGSIALEIISKSIYEQQIPNIIKTHTKLAHKSYTMTTIKQRVTEKTPSSKIDYQALKHTSNHSISVSVIFALLLCVSTIQIILHQRLKQNAALNRLALFRYGKSKLYLTYIGTHTLILLCTLGIIALIVQQQLSLIFYLRSLLIIIIFECGIAWLLFKVNTLSHRLFMALIYGVMIAIIYIFLQF